MNELDSADGIVDSHDEYLGDPKAELKSQLIILKVQVLHSLFDSSSVFRVFQLCVDLAAHC